MNEKLLLVVNPVSGKGRAKKILFELVRQFSENGCIVTVYPTKSSEDTVRYVRTFASRYGQIVVCGGDGTLSQVVAGLVAGIPEKERRPPLGYIPAGTANDLAKNLGLPTKVPEAVETVLRGQRFDYDVGLFNDRTFTYIAAFGAFTEASYATPQPLKNSLGHFAYILEGIKSLPKIQSYHIELSFDGVVLEDDFIFGAVTNSTSVGGLLRLSPETVRLNDGRFEMLLVKEPRQPAQAQQILSDLLTQRFGEETVLLHHPSAIGISAAAEIPWTLDGEFGGVHSAVSIVNQPGSIRFLTKNPAKRTGSARR